MSEIEISRSQIFFNFFLLLSKEEADNGLFQPFSSGVRQLQFQCNKGAANRNRLKRVKEMATLTKKKYFHNSTKKLEFFLFPIGGRARICPRFGPVWAGLGRFGLLWKLLVQFKPRLICFREIFINEK